MYFYDPYGARPSGRYYRMPDNQEPVFPDTSCPNTVFVQELGDQPVEGFSPMDLLNLGPPGKRDIVMNGLPTQEGRSKSMIVVGQPSKVEERREIVDQFSDSRVNSMFMDTSQTIDDGLEHPGYGVTDDELTPTATDGIHVLPDRPESTDEPELEPEDQAEQGESGFHQYGGQQTAEGIDQESTPISMTDQPPSEPSGEPEKSGGIPGWLLIGGGVLLISLLFGKKSG